MLKTVPASAPAEPEPVPEPEPGHGFGELLRNSAVFALGQVTAKVVGVLLLPFLTRALTPGDFGRLDVLSTLATTVTSVLVLGLDIAATRLYPELTDTERRRLFGTWLAIAAAVLLPTVLVLVAGAGAISRLLFGTSNEALGVAMVGVFAAANLSQVIGLTALRNQGRARTYAAASMTAVLVNGLAVVVLVSVSPGAGPAMVGVAMGAAVGATGSLFMARRLAFGGRPSAASGKALLALGLPLVPALAATWIGDFANRAILLGASGETQVGLLSVAIRFGSVGVLVVTGFQLAWMPRAFAQAERPEALPRIARDAERIIVAVTAALLPMAVFAPELLRLVAGSDYDGARPAVGFSLVTTVGLALVTIAGMPSALGKRMRDIGAAGTAGALTAVVANVAFGRMWGATGTSAALALGQATALAVVLTLSRRPGRATLPLRWSHLARPAAAMVVLALVCTLSSSPGVALRLAAGAAFCAVLLADPSTRRSVRLRSGRP